MRRPNRTAIRPAIESMEIRSLMSGGSSAVSIISPTIGVDKPSGTFDVDPSLGAPLEIFVLSQPGRHPFRPVTEINPRTIEIDGMSVPGARVSRDPVDENGDGIPDAIVTVPRSALNLTPGVDALTFTAVDRLSRARRPIVIVGAAAIFVGTPGQSEGSGGSSGAGGGTVGGGGTGGADGGGSGGVGNAGSAGGQFAGVGGAGRGRGSLNTYVNGYVTIFNATGNTYLYTVPNYYPLGGLPAPGTAGVFNPGTSVTINTGPGFFGSNFFIQVAITIPGQAPLPPATFGYLFLSTSPNITSQFDLILNNQGQLVFVPA